MRIPDSTSAALKGVDDCVCVVRYIYLCAESEWCQRGDGKDCTRTVYILSLFALKILCTQINDLQQGLSM